ncbi:glycosyltransferase family 4 protein [Pectobacterium polaris]|uniref:glycosyltransferase family 4 protein n=1 Tax=Pectobacterium polaris TaxID=2042057 RepID=UPI001581ED2C|nr:glycosyltransferase family 4 protein [Pectobacterium polaris]
MKKILFILPDITNVGGVERVVTILSNELSEHLNVNISLAVKKSTKPPAFHLNSGVKILNLPHGSLNFLFSVKELINSFDWDMIVIHSMNKLTISLLSIGCRHHNMWSYEHVSYVNNPMYLRVLKKFLYKNLSGVIVITYCDKKNYTNLSHRVVKINNPSPLNICESGYDFTSKKIVSIGRLTEQKGFDFLLSAWSRIYKKYPDWSLDIWGEGVLKNTLIKSIKDLDLKNVSLCGISNQVDKVYRNSSFYVMSSRYEGLGLVLVEAASQGLPLISFDCPYGPGEIIDNGNNGFLVPCFDIENLAECMEKLINSQELRMRMSKESLVTAKKYSISNVIREWSEIIN